MVDHERIEQVLVNLIGNAIKYSPKGGEITIRVWEDAEEGVGVSVQDEGIGIPVYQQGQIFGRLMRADNAHALSIHGTGLGLYLCRELVEQHGGRIWFQSAKAAHFSSRCPNNVQKPEWRSTPVCGPLGLRINPTDRDYFVMDSSWFSARSMLG